jgi:hypothetical protein
MPLLNPENPNANWDDVLALWEEIVNWTRLKPSEKKLDRQIRALLIFLSNEKDWLKEEDQKNKKLIEKAIAESNYMAVVIDLANTIKHKKLTRYIRSDAQFTKYYGRTVNGKKVSRRLHYISIRNSKHIEILQILNGAIDEFEELRSLILDNLKN